MGSKGYIKGFDKVILLFNIINIDQWSFYPLNLFISEIIIKNVISIWLWLIFKNSLYCL